MAILYETPYGRLAHVLEKLTEAQFVQYMDYIDMRLGRRPAQTVPERPVHDRPATRQAPSPSPACRVSVRVRRVHGRKRHP